MASNQFGLQGIVFELPLVNGIGTDPGFLAKVCAELTALRKGHPHLEIQYIWKTEQLQAKQLPTRFWAYSSRSIGYYLIGRAIGDALLKTTLGLIPGCEPKLT